MTTANNDLFEVIQEMMVSSSSRRERLEKVSKAVRVSYSIPTLPNNVSAFLVKFTLNAVSTVEQDEDLFAVLEDLAQGYGEPIVEFGTLVLHSTDEEIGVMI